MNEKVSTKQAILLTLRCTKDVNHYVPGRMISILLSSIMTALTPYITIWFSAQIINELAGLRRPHELWKWVILTVSISTILALISAVLKHWESFTDSMNSFYKEKIFTDKFFSMDYANIDDQKVRDLYAQIKQNENWQGWGIEIAIENIKSSIQAVTGIIGAIFLTVSLFTKQVPESAGSWTVLNSPLFAVALLGLMVFIIWFGLSRNAVVNQRLAHLAEEATLGNRSYSAIYNMIGDGKRRLDIRTYNQQNLTDTLMQQDAFSPNGSFDKLARSFDAILAYIGEGSSAVLTGAVYLFTCLKAWGGAFGIGSVTQYVGAVTALSGNLSMLLNGIDQMRNNAEFIQDTYDFLELPNEMYQGSLTTEKRSDRQYEVEFKNVSFKYPGTENWALKNVSMKFKVGKRLAIVGENGSGKTTFIKLLCRLYDPQEGQILLNGIDIRKYNYRDYMNIFSVVFQDFQLLSQPLGANVAGSQKYDCEKVRNALIDAGFGNRLENMPNGLDTVLYKEFSENGVEVSGGEAQKIAIARALYKNAPFIILDEPTAALDPIAEAEIYGKFNAISGDKTTIYISHRLSSCKFCDEIAVFQDGTVIQQGTHEQLLADTNGKYFKLWNAQAQYYTDKQTNAKN